MFPQTNPSGRSISKRQGCEPLFPWSPKSRRVFRSNWGSRLNGVSRSSWALRLGICLILGVGVGIAPVFINPAVGESPVAGDGSVSSKPSVTQRQSLARSFAKFRRKKSGCVAFIGGSITEMNGYRPMVMKDLQSQFPDTKFEFINAGISSTCSHTGAFRLADHVLQHKPDLLFIEFAVNDDQDAAHSYENAVRGMEGIVRSAIRSIPEIDLVITHFVNEPMLEAVQNGKVPTSIAAHEAVAQRYHITTCNVAVELAKQISDGTMSWKVYGGVHPKPAGNRIAADLIQQVIQQSASQIEQLTPSARLPEPIDQSSFEGGRFLDLNDIVLGEGWSHQTPDWKSLPGSSRERYEGRPLAVSTTPGAELEIKFTGTAAGLFVLAGPDAGAVDYSVDGGPWQTKDLYHRFSKGLHYPRTVVLESGLKPGAHRVKVRVAKPLQPGRTAVRVLHFVGS